MERHTHQYGGNPITDQDRKRNVSQRIGVSNIGVFRKDFGARNGRKRREQVYQAIHQHSTTISNGLHEE